MLPIFLAFGYVYTTFRFYCLAAPLITLSILILASYFSQILVLVLVNVFPARWIKEIMRLGTIIAFHVLYIVDP
ncbi:MAG: hypothetical protein AMR96_06130 [Candidatus Adiutrix intracellularis]|nr:MAG: hypothetical protein AMR96_06130 [Candidatus Adiutrix intracellularis]